MDVPKIPRARFVAVSPADLLYRGVTGPVFTMLYGMDIHLYLVDGSQIDPRLLDPMATIADDAAKVLTPRDAPFEDLADPGERCSS